MENESTITTNLIKRIYLRLKDRKKWPRSWWYPSIEIIIRKLKQPVDNKEVEKLHEINSETIRRTMLALLIFDLFCLMTVLSTPDVALIGGSSVVKLPYAEVQVSFLGFFIAAPLILVILTIYLHIFLAYSRQLEAIFSSQNITNAESKTSMLKIPTLFNLNLIIARLLSVFIFYWLTPITLLIMTLKAIPLRGIGLGLGIVSTMVMSCLLFLQIRRCPSQIRIWLNPLLSLILILILVISTITLLGHEKIRRPLYLFREDLRNSYLPGLDLRGANLVGANLQDSQLRGTNFNFADLREANLSNARLQEANLSFANLSNANLNNSDLSKSYLKGANLSKSSLHNTKLSNTDLTDADISEANLEGAILEKTNLSNANLKKTILYSTNLNYSNLEGADLSESNLSFAKIQDAAVNRANFMYANVTKTDFFNTHIKEAQIEQACFDGKIGDEPVVNIGSWKPSNKCK